MYFFVYKTTNTDFGNEVSYPSVLLETIYCDVKDVNICMLLFGYKVRSIIIQCYFLYEASEQKFIYQKEGRAWENMWLPYHTSL